MSSSEVMTSSDMPSSCSLTTLQLTTITRRGGWSKVKVAQEQAAEMERKTRYQSKSLSWYEQHRCRITSSFFGRVCRRLSSTSPDSLLNSILNQHMYRSMPLSRAWGKDNKDRALSAYNKSGMREGTPVLK